VFIRLIRLRRFTLRAVFAVISAISVACGLLHWQAWKTVEQLTRIQQLGGSLLRVDSPLRIPWLPYPYDEPLYRVVWVDFSIMGDELDPPLPGHVTDQDLPFIATLKHIEWLGLANNRITDDGVRYIAGMSALKELSLAYTDVTDDGIEMLSHMRVEVLDLDHTCITDRAMDSVATLSKLQSLNIKGTRVTDTGLRCLERLNDLQLIELDGTKVTEDGIARLERRFTSLCVVR
jgi:hypothetical protein